MAENDTRLRSLIQLIPPARALRNDLEQSLHLETYAGLGDAALRTLEGLRASVAAITQDPFIASLSASAPPAASDKEKVALARLAAGQLVAYLEGQTGLAGSSDGGGGGNNINIQKAPVINLSNVHGVSSDVLTKLLGMTGGRPDAEDDEDDE